MVLWSNCVCVFWTVSEFIYISECFSLELAIASEKGMAKYDILHNPYFTWVQLLRMVIND